jgi:hypothetical protein
MIRPRSAPGGTVYCAQTLEHPSGSAVPPEPFGVACGRLLARRDYLGEHRKLLDQDRRLQHIEPSIHANPHIVVVAMQSRKCWH